MIDIHYPLEASSLSMSLDAVAALIKGFLVDFSVEFTDDDWRELPDRLFNMAVSAGWLPEPTPLTFTSVEDMEDNPDVEPLGHYAVPAAYSREFEKVISGVMRELAPKNYRLAELRRIVADRQAKGEWKGPAEPGDEYLRTHAVLTDDGALDITDREATVSPRPSSKFREAVDRWQRETGKPLSDLAAKAGVGDSTLYRILAGKFSYKRHLESLKCVATVLRCDWRDFHQG